MSAIQSGNSLEDNKVANDQTSVNIAGCTDHVSSVAIDVEPSTLNSKFKKFLIIHPLFSDVPVEDSQIHGYFYFNSLLVLLEILMFFILMKLDNSKDFFVALLSGPSVKTLYYMGARCTWSIQNGQIWRLLTPVFLHANLLSLLFSILSHLTYAIYLESIWGNIVFLKIYISSVIGGNLLSSILLPEYIGIGTTAALFGTSGAALSYVLLNYRYDHDKSIFYRFLFWLLLCNVFGILLSFDVASHLGGFLTGVLLGMALFYNSGRHSSYFYYIGIIGCLLYFISGSVILFCFVNPFKPLWIH